MTAVLHNLRLFLAPVSAWGAGELITEMPACVDVGGSVISQGRVGAGTEERKVVAVAPLRRRGLKWLEK